MCGYNCSHELRQFCLPLCMYGRDKEVYYRREVPAGGWRSRVERGNLGSTMCSTSDGLLINRHIECDYGIRVDEM